MAGVVRPHLKQQRRSLPATPMRKNIGCSSPRRLCLKRRRPWRASTCSPWPAAGQAWAPTTLQASARTVLWWRWPCQLAVVVEHSRSVCCV